MMRAIAVGIGFILCLSEARASGDPRDYTVRPRETSIANGCGPEFTRSVDEADDGTRFADEHIYRAAHDLVLDEEDTRYYYVNFRAACDLHDVAYAGCGSQNPGACRYFIYDEINQRTYDFSTWSRQNADDKLLADTRALCDRYVTPENGFLDAALTVRVKRVTARDREAAANMNQRCKAHGTGLPGVGAWGAATLYQLVRELGASSFSRFPGRRAEPAHSRGEYEKLP